jgi:hypothetical protein
LAEILRRVRAMGHLDENHALDALDELLSAVSVEAGAEELESEIGWQRKNALESMERIRAVIARVRTAAGEPGDQTLWTAQGLASDANNFEQFFDSSIRAEFEDEIARLRSEAKQAARDAERAAHTKMIREYATQVIHNASSVRSVVVGIDEALDSLRKLGPLPDGLTQVARQGKERAARYRSRKRLDEAEIASAGGNTKKAEKLRNEAAALLAQDWAQIFPGEQAPLSVGK